MKLSELFRLVWLNLSQNKSKAVLTSVGIIVGSATIMLVIAIGTGGRAEVAEQFKNLNAGSIDVTYDSSASADDEFGEMGDMGGGPGGDMGGGMPGGGDMGGGMPGGGGMAGGGGGMPGGGGPGGDMGGGRDQNSVTLSSSDLQDLLDFVPGLSEGTIAYSTTSSVEGGELEESSTYTIAGVTGNYASMSNMTMSAGSFLTDEDNTAKSRVCVIGNSAAKTIFGSVQSAQGSTLYIDNRAYTVSGVLDSMGSVASGISPDDTIFIPYETGIKYLTGDEVTPTITVVAENTDQVDTVKSNIKEVLAESYPNAGFTISDAGSKMEAANQSNQTLTYLLIAMAVIVFIVGGIGIMNVLFVSVRERTNEIGILKAIGCSRRDILLEFLLEASAISMLGALLGIGAGVAITPIIETLGVRVDLSVYGGVLALVFGILTGSVFGFYPAYKASRMIPVQALNAE